MNFSPSINRGIRAFLSKAPRHSLAARAVSDLRSNHAGEWGAVKIYEGAEMAAQWRLSCTVDSRALVELTTLINFVQRHRDSESKHLLLMSEMLEPNLRTRLLPLWSVAGFLLGAVRPSSETKPIPVFNAPPSAGACADWGPFCSVPISPPNLHVCFVH
jgi:demethoxyubiquinone hydroxylase (CLK1/Coq7/Cat5 family)